MNDLYLKNQYFKKHLLIEKETLNKYQQDLKRLSSTLRSNYDPKNLPCIRCSRLLGKLDDQQISRLLENNQHVKQEYDRALCPVQYLLVFICFVNSVFTTIIFEKPLIFFLLSNLFCIGCFCIHGEFFFGDQSLLISTVIIGTFICLFSVYLLIHAIITLVVIMNYHMMKSILISNGLLKLQLNEKIFFKKNLPNHQKFN